MARIETTAPFANSFQSYGFAKETDSTHQGLWAVLPRELLKADGGVNSASAQRQSRRALLRLSLPRTPLLSHLLTCLCLIVSNDSRPSARWVHFPVSCEALIL